MSNIKSSKHKDRDSYAEESSTKSSKRSKTEKGSYRSIKTLCVSQFNLRLNEEDAKNMLYKEFRKYGEHGITMSRGPTGGKIAYVNFRYHEDAMAVRSAYKSKSLSLDPAICIDFLTDESSQDKKLGSSKPSSPLIHSRSSDHFAKEYMPSPEMSVPPKSTIRTEKSYQDELEDKSATRTLFIGNLDHEINEDELGEIFGRFGYIEDIDIKRGGLTHGSVYAFIRFLNLEMARRAKTEMSGQYIRKYQCRIGYGKHVPSNCLWVGSLGPRVTKDDLEKCFSSFNPLRIEWSYGRTSAYLVFSSLEVATSVLNSMQGFEICPGYAIRLDYSDENHLAALMNPSRDGQVGASGTLLGKPANKSTDVDPKAVKPVSPILLVIPQQLRKALAEIQNIQQLSKQLQVVWKGELALKNVSFHIKLCQVNGTVKMIDALLKDQKVESPKLVLDKLLPFSHSKTTSLTEGLIGNTFECSLLLALPDGDDEGSENFKHFKMAAAYLKKKQSSAMTLLPPAADLNKPDGVLHLFPASNFSKQILQVFCPKFADSLSLEQMLVLVNTVTV